MKAKKIKALLTYWFAHYCSKDHCTLCGNSGIIDSRGLTTAAGLLVGRLNWCICPNGQAFRASGTEIKAYAKRARRF